MFKIIGYLKIIISYRRIFKNEKTAVIATVLIMLWYIGSSLVSLQQHTVQKKAVSAVVTPNRLGTKNNGTESIITRKITMPAIPKPTISNVISSHAATLTAQNSRSNSAQNTPIPTLTTTPMPTLTPTTTALQKENVPTSGMHGTVDVIQKNQPTITPKPTLSPIVTVPSSTGNPEFNVNLANQNCIIISNKSCIVEAPAVDIHL